MQRVRKAVEPPQGAWDDAKIVCALAEKMGVDLVQGDAKNIDEVFDEIARVTPSYRGLSYKRIDLEGIQWPCTSEKSGGTDILHKDGFVRGKGLFHSVLYVPPAERANAEYPLLLTTGRVLYQYHTGTMTRKVQGLAAKSPAAYVEISVEDAKQCGVGDGDTVKVTSRRGSISVPVRISEKAVAGTVFIPFHFAEAAANVLTNSAACPESGIAEVKVCAVRVELNDNHDSS